MIKKLITLILFNVFVFTGCGVTKDTTVSGVNQGITVSVEAENTIKKVAKIYDEQTPQITEIRIAQEETTRKPMYMVFLKGNFRKGEQKSQKLEFSMTEDGKKVWALTSDSWGENEINISN